MRLPKTLPTYWALKYHSRGALLVQLRALCVCHAPQRCVSRMHNVLHADKQPNECSSYTVIRMWRVSLSRKYTVVPCSEIAPQYIGRWQSDYCPSPKGRAPFIHMEHFLLMLHKTWQHAPVVQISPRQ